MSAEVPSLTGPQTHEDIPRLNRVTAYVSRRDIWMPVPTTELPLTQHNIRNVEDVPGGKS